MQAGSSSHSLLSKGSKRGMKAGGIFPNKGPCIKGPSSYLPSLHLSRLPILAVTLVGTLLLALVVALKGALKL